MNDRVEVKIHGQTFRMRTGSGEEYIQKVARYVDGVIQETAGHVGNQPMHRVAIMAAIQIADSLFQEQARQEGGGSGEVEEIIERLIAQSDQLLAG